MFLSTLFVATLIAWPIVPASAAPIPLYPTKVAKSEALVVLLSFSNYPDIITADQANSLYFGSGNSVASYFSNQSLGAYSLTGQVVSLAYNGPSTDFTGMSEWNAENAMISDVVGYLSSTGFNWAPFENSQGQITKLILLRSVPEPNLTSGCTPWPTCAGFFWSFEQAGLNIPTGDGATITNADFVSQTDPVGILDHEFGHLLGAMDTYDISNTTNCVVGVWDLYSSGAYNGMPVGTSPASIDPYQRAYLGWIRPTVISQNGAYTLPPVETSNQVYEIALPNSSTDYLIENIQPIGNDGRLPGPGLLIWQVNTNTVNPYGSYWQQDAINSSGPNGPRASNLGLLIVNGRTGQAQPVNTITCGSESDLFPGSSGSTGEVFSNGTTGVVISQIQQQQNLGMTFTLTNTPAATILGPTNIDQGVQATYTINYVDASGNTNTSGNVAISTPWGNQTAQMQNGVATFSLTPTTASSGDITATTNGTMSSLNVVVNPSIVTILAPKAIVVGQPAQFTINETHADGTSGSSGTFTASTPWGAASGNMISGVGTFSITPNSSASGTVSVSLWDGGTDSIPVSISTPTLSIAGPVNIQPGVTTTFTVSDGVYGVEASGSQSFSVSTPWGDQTGTITNGSGTFQLVAPQPGRGTVAITTQSGQTTSIAVVCAEFPYQDVPASSWAYPAISHMWSIGAFENIPGWSGSSFGFSTPITRAEFVYLLMQLLPNTKIAPETFSDVPSNYWAATAIGEAADLGIVNGTGGGDFSPNAILTRAQMAAILVRAFGFTDNGTRFSFSDVPSNYWAYTDLNIMWQNGVMLGTSSVDMSPSATATRAEAITMLYRASKLR